MGIDIVDCGIFSNEYVTWNHSFACADSTSVVSTGTMLAARAILWLPTISVNAESVATSGMTQALPGEELGVEEWLFQQYIQVGIWVIRSAANTREDLKEDLQVRICGHMGSDVRNVEVNTRNMQALPLILQWVQCFAGMMGVLSTKYPWMVPELMASLGHNCEVFKALAHYDRA